MTYRNFLLSLAVFGMVAAAVVDVAAEVRLNSVTQSPRAGDFYYESSLDVVDCIAVGIGRLSFLGGRGSGLISGGRVAAATPKETTGGQSGAANDLIADMPAGAVLDGRGRWVVAQFDFDKSEISDQSVDRLNEALDVIKNNPDLNFIIQGHTCDLGPVSYNQRLSEKRAKSVYDYLVLKGIDAPRMTPAGLAFTQPAAANDTDAGRALNRRVEVQPVKPSR